MSLTTASKITHRARCARAAPAGGLGLALHRQHDHTPPSQPGQRGPQTRGFRFSRRPPADHEPTSTGPREARSNEQRGQDNRMLHNRWSPDESRRADDILKRMVGDYWGTASKSQPADKQTASEVHTTRSRSAIFAWDDSPRLSDSHYVRTAYTYDYSQSPLWNLRNRWLAAEEEKQERQTAPPSASNEPDYVIDPITNRKVPKPNPTVSHQASESHDSVEKCPKEGGTVADSLGRVFADGPPPPEELKKYDETEIDERPWESSVQAAAPAPSRPTSPSSTRLLNNNEAWVDEPKPAPGELDKYGAVQYQEPDGGSKGIPDEPRPEPEELTKYGAVRYQEPDGHSGSQPTTNTPEARKEELLKYGFVRDQESDGQSSNGLATRQKQQEQQQQQQYDDLDKYGAVRYQEPDGRTGRKADESRNPRPLEQTDAYIDEPRPEPGELSKYGAVRHQELDAKPNKDVAARQGQQLPEDLDKYGAVRAHEPDGKYKPAQSEENPVDAKELRQYNGAFRSHEPEGKYAVTDNDLPLAPDAQELAHYGAFRSHEPDGIYAATASELSHEVADDLKEYGAPETRTIRETETTRDSLLALAALGLEVQERALARWPSDQLEILDIERLGWAAFGGAMKDLHKDGFGLHQKIQFPHQEDLGIALASGLRNRLCQALIREVDSNWGLGPNPFESSRTSHLFNPSTVHQSDWSASTPERLARSTFRQVLAASEGLRMMWPKRGLDDLKDSFQEAIKESVMAVCGSSARPAGGDAAKGEPLGMGGLEAYAEAEAETETEAEPTGSYIRDFPGEFAKTWAARTSTQEHLLPLEMEAAEAKSAAIEDALEPAMNRQTKSEYLRGRESAVADSYSKKPQGLETAFTEEREKLGEPKTEKPYSKVYGQLEEHGIEDAQHASSSSSPLLSSSDPAAATLGGPGTTLYKILAYDSNSQTINVAETTSLAADPSTPLTPPEVLLRLSHPARFFPHFGPLQEQGFEIVSGSGDVLVFRKASQLPATTNAATSTAATATSSSRPPTSKIGAAPSPSPSGGVEQTDSATSLGSSWAKEDKNVRLQAWHDLFVASDTAAKEDKSGGKSRWSDSNTNANNNSHSTNGHEAARMVVKERPGVVKRLLVSAASMAGIAYALGVAGEFLQKPPSSSPSSSPTPSLSSPTQSSPT